MKYKTSLYKIGLLAAFVSLLALGLYLFLESRKIVDNKVQNVAQETVDNRDNDDNSSWEMYMNEEFGYSLQHPRLLSVREMKDQGVYLHFVRFEENKFSQGKGVAVGVSESNFTEEVERIKKTMEEDDNAKLIEEMDTDLNGYSAIKLYYEPTNTELGEARSILVIEKSPYIYSISSVPEQMDSILNSFKFTESNGIEDSREDVFCGGFANIPCPQGFKCVLEGDYPDAGGTCVKE
jgi:hypothetical protein